MSRTHVIKNILVINLYKFLAEKMSIFMRKKNMNLKTEAKNFLENLKFMEKTNHQLTNTYTAPVCMLKSSAVDPDPH
jgi:hypothetical protein